MRKYIFIHESRMVDIPLKRHICLVAQVLFFFGAGTWTAAASSRIRLLKTETEVRVVHYITPANPLTCSPLPTLGDAFATMLQNSFVVRKSRLEDPLSSVIS